LCAVQQFLLRLVQFVAGNGKGRSQPGTGLPLLTRRTLPALLAGFAPSHAQLPSAVWDSVHASLREVATTTTATLSPDKCDALLVHGQGMHYMDSFVTGAHFLLGIGDALEGSWSQCELLQSGSFQHRVMADFILPVCTAAQHWIAHMCRAMQQLLAAGGGYEVSVDDPPQSPQLQFDPDSDVPANIISLLQQYVNVAFLAAPVVYAAAATVLPPPSSTPGDGAEDTLATGLAEVRAELSTRWLSVLYSLQQAVCFSVAHTGQTSVPGIHPFQVLYETAHVLAMYANPEEYDPEDDDTEAVLPGLLHSVHNTELVLGPAAAAELTHAPRGAQEQRLTWQLAQLTARTLQEGGGNIAHTLHDAGSVLAACSAGLCRKLDLLWAHPFQSVVGHCLGCHAEPWPESTGDMPAELCEDWVAWGMQLPMAVLHLQELASAVLLRAPGDAMEVCDAEGRRGLCTAAEAYLWSMGVCGVGAGVCAVWEWLILQASGGNLGGEAGAAWAGTAAAAAAAQHLGTAVSDGVVSAPRFAVQAPVDSSDESEDGDDSGGVAWGDFCIAIHVPGTPGCVDQREQEELMPQWLQEEMPISDASLPAVQQMERRTPPPHSARRSTRDGVPRAAAPCSSSGAQRPACISVACS